MLFSIKTDCHCMMECLKCQEKEDKIKALEAEIVELESSKSTIFDALLATRQLLEQFEGAQENSKPPPLDDNGLSSLCNELVHSNRYHIYRHDILHLKFARILNKKLQEAKK